MTIRTLLAVAAAAAILACSPPPTVRGDREAADDEYATVAAPLADARVVSPFTVTGEAPSAWFYEERFDAILLGDDGTVYAQAPARASADWQREGVKPFTAEFSFTVSADTPAVVILQEQSIGEADSEPLEVRVPVVLTPAG